ncbi:SAGA-associated factor 29 isoform X2 [Cimex lectularius]|uniref:SGF29 C-terminal domain-containing protein n=1 Tax=Cimex lectularius TaxID=79782 RepID=A0A8I6S680_CIMLE|nr:SAGA-associated factor 29 isoform X2 [Cimex lectularius]XP_014256615.1 SAGA-associated factor 29 isoform X2 [Cimex lectularius]
MPFSLEDAAVQVLDRLRTLNSLLHDIEAERETGEKTLDTISKTQDKITQEGKLTSYNQQKLKNLYHNAIRDATQEEELLRQALTTINEIRTICNERRLQARNGGHREIFHKGTLLKSLQISAQTLPLWVGKPGMKPPPLCGAIPAEPSYIAKPGDMVAALVKNVEAEEGEEDYNWILAEVVTYNSATKKYEVDDIDDEQKLRHTLSKSRVIPLPLMRANPATDSNALFPKGSMVMAHFPRTTCFYKALVNQLPETTTDDYEVLFTDKSYPGGYAPPLKVPQRYVIDIKEKPCSLDATSSDSESD